MYGASPPLLDSPPLARYGLPELVYGASPAAGANFSQAIDGAHLTRLVGLYCTLTTSSDVADRYVSVQYRDAAGNTYAVSGAPVATTASSTQAFYFSAFLGTADWPVGATVLAPLAPILLVPTHTFRIVVTNIQAADALTTIRYVQERFFSDVKL